MASPSRTVGVKLVRGPFVRLRPHFEATDSTEEWLPWAKSLTGPTVADLFCGAGGLSLGLADAGFKIVMGIDSDHEALETHRALFPGLTAAWDLADDEVVVKVADLIKEAGVTVVAGGPPCQPFSKAGRSMIRDLVRAGRREKHDERRDLWQSFLRVIALARPDGVVMENVPDMALERDMMILRTLVDELEGLGYGVEERVVEAWRYGVPQFRNRLILVALRDGAHLTWPAPSDAPVTVHNAIGDMPSVEGGWRPDGGADGWSPYGGPQTEFQRAARVGVSPDDTAKLYDHITRPVREDDAEAFAQMNSDTKYSDLDADLKRYREDIFNDKYKRLDAHQLSRTITAHIAKDGYWYIHPYQDRTLTVREAARLQTFPDWVRFAGPPTAAFRQIGNAVPPQLGEAIGRALIDALQGPQGASEDPRPTLPSTRRVASTLADWFGKRKTLTVPWLAATSRWQVIQGEMLLGRARPQAIRSVWPLLEKMQTPAETIRRRDQVTEIASWIDRAHRADELLQAAQWYVDHPEALDDGERIADAPTVPAAIAGVAVRVVPDETVDPVLTTHGVLRVAARFAGSSVDRVNKGSDGRLAVARMIGVDPLSDGAHLGLIELAASVCRPQQPECGVCPVSEWCVEATRRLASSASTNPEPRRSPATASSTPS